MVRDSPSLRRSLHYRGWVWGAIARDGFGFVSRVGEVDAGETTRKKSARAPLPFRSHRPHDAFRTRYRVRRDLDPIAPPLLRQTRVSSLWISIYPHHGDGRRPSLYARRQLMRMKEAAATSAHADAPPSRTPSRAHLSSLLMEGALMALQMRGGRRGRTKPLAGMRW